MTVYWNVKTERTKILPLCHRSCLVHFLLSLVTEWTGDTYYMQENAFNPKRTTEAHNWRDGQYTAGLIEEATIPDGSNIRDDHLCPNSVRSLLHVQWKLGKYWDPAVTVWTVSDFIVARSARSLGATSASGPAPAVITSSSTLPLDSPYAISYRCSIHYNRVSISSRSRDNKRKHSAVTTLAFQGHVTSSDTWLFITLDAIFPTGIPL